MEVTEKVPITNDKKGRSIKLTLDTDTRVLAVDAPVLWGRKTEVDISILRERLNRLQSTIGDHE